MNYHVAMSNVIVDILRQSLNEAVFEHLATRHIRSPISIVKASNLNLEAVWNFGWGVRGRGGACRGDLFRLFEPQFGHCD